MHVIRVRNVMQALPAGVAYLVEHGKRAPSRAGEVLVAPGPVTTAYTHPRERVLSSTVRDANPFFHLMEALWVLAGRQDAAFLDNYIRDYSQRFAESGGHIHDAYGFRLRHSLGFDQLDYAVEALRSDSSSRQCVLQIWDAFVQDDLSQREWKTRPCNTHIYLRVRQEVEAIGYSLVHGMGGAHQELGSFLDITVCCRSNDIVWGAYGANVVQFSMLQEYLAARIGVGVGTYYQVSNNYHAYVSELERLRQRAGGCSLEELPSVLTDEQYFTYQHNLVDDPGTFDREFTTLMINLDQLHSGVEDLDDLEWHADAKNRFLTETAWPAASAMRLHRLGYTELAVDMARKMEDPAWRTACVTWLLGRKR